MFYCKCSSARSGLAYLGDRMYALARSTAFLFEFEHGVNIVPSQLVWASALFGEMVMHSFHASIAASKSSKNELLEPCLAFGSSPVGELTQVIVGNS